MTSAAPISVAAQSSSARAAAFEAVLADPTDPAAAIEYARLTLADGDYEAAAATLERLLDAEPANAAARFELAVIYYTLGSYEIAKFHFLLLQEGGAGSPAVADYLDRIAGATAPQSFGGSAALGAAVSDDDDTAVALSFNLDWDLDLGGANDTAWQTDLFGNFYSGSDDFDSGRLLLRTGPQISIAGEAYGARLRPYVEVDLSLDDDDDDSVTYSLGAQYLNTHSDLVSSFANLSFGHRDGSGATSDAEVWQALAGVSLTPSEATRIRLSLRAADRDADIATDSRGLTGARAEVSYRGRGIFGADDVRWSLRGFAQHDELEFDVGGREDTLRSYGISWRAFITDDAFVDLSASQIDRSSSDAAQNETTPLFSLQFGLEF